MTSNSSFSQLGAAIIFLFTAATNPSWGGTVSELPTNFLVNAIKADPVRNQVYAVDQLDNLLLDFDMTTGAVVHQVAIDDGSTSGEIAISVDGSTLYLAESGEDEIMVFSLPNLTLVGTLPLDFPPSSIASAVGGRLFASEPNGISNEIVELDPSTGDILNTFGTAEEYYYAPLLRINDDGTHLYAGITGISGDLDLEMYNLTGGTISAATPYGYDSENMIDFQPDETKGRIYAMNGGIYGINVILTATDSYSTVWPLTGAYGVAVGYNSQSNVVFGASGESGSGDIRAYNRVNGAPIADYIVATGNSAVQGAGIAQTANGNLFYVRSDVGYPNGPATLGIISPGGITPTLNPTVTQTVNFTSVNYLANGQSMTLSATDNSGIPLTYTVVSGPGYIFYNTLYSTGNGTIVISASNAGSALYKPTTVTQNIYVGPVPQSIAAFAVIPDQTYGELSFLVTVPTATSGLTVTLSVKSGPAVVTTGNRIVLTGAGPVTLAANQGGNSSYLAAPQQTTSFVVDKGSQTIRTLSPIANQVYGVAPFTVLVPTATSSLPVVLSVQSGPAIVTGNKVTLKGPGTVVIAADQAGNSNYLAAPTVTTSFTVTSHQAIGAFKAIAARAYTATPFTIVPPVSTSGLPVTVSVLSGPATISGNSVTLTGVGTVTLAANQAGNSTYDAATQVTTAFVVVKDTQTISAFTPITGVTYGSAPFTITPPVAISGLPVAVTVKSGPATISGNTITVTGVGEVILAADQAGSSVVSAAKEVLAAFIVGKEAQTIIPFSTISPQIYGVAPFAITLPTASSGLPVSVVVHSGFAKLAGSTLSITGPGTVTLYAYQVGSTLFTAAPLVTTSFVVSKTPQTIAAFATIPDHTFGDPAFVITPPASSSGLVVAVKVLSGPAVIVANKVTLTGGGTVVLAANQVGSTTVAPATQVTTSFVVNPKAQTIAAFTTIPAKTYGVVPFAILVPKATSGLAVAISVVSGSATYTAGKVIVTGAGPVELAADQAGNASYTAASEVTTSFVVSKAAQVITPFHVIAAKLSTVLPFAIILPTSSSKLPVSTTVLSGPATISGDIVTVTGTGTVVLAADQAGDANHNAATEVTTSFLVH